MFKSLVINYFRRYGLGTIGILLILMSLLSWAFDDVTTIWRFVLHKLRIAFLLAGVLMLLATGWLPRGVDLLLAGGLILSAGIIWLRTDNSWADFGKTVAAKNSAMIGALQILLIITGLLLIILFIVEMWRRLARK